MIKYLGSKRVLVPNIVRIVDAVPDVDTVWDAFTGTTRVAQALKHTGRFVTANDLSTYAETFARCYVEADADALDVDALAGKLEHLSSLPGTDGYVTETFSRQSRFLQPHNAQRIDAIRPEIDRISDDPIEHAILLTSLIEAADRVDSTTGVQMAYLKQWASRSFRDLELRMPEVLAGSGAARRSDANDCARQMDAVDLAYLDPPYNQHSYHANYHVWETIARGDEPETYGVACKRVDCRTVKSDYNSKRRARDAFADLVAATPARYLLVSFNAEGYIPVADLVEILEGRGDVAVAPVDVQRYVGSQIGIYNPAGIRTGTAGHRRTTEYLLLAGPGAADIVECAIASETTTEHAAS